MNRQKSARIKQKLWKRRRHAAQLRDVESIEAPPTLMERLKSQLSGVYNVSIAVFLMLLGSTALFPLAQSAEGQYAYKGKAVTREYSDALAQATQAHELILKNKFQEADFILSKAITVIGDDADANNNLGLALLRLNRAEEALPYYEQAVKLDPKLESAYIGLSDAYNALGRMADSLRVNNSFLAKFPHSAFNTRIKKQSDYIKEQIDLLASNKSAAKSAGKNLQDSSYLADSNGSRMNSWRRSKKPITVCLQGGETCKNWKPAYVAMMKEAFDEWAKNSNDLVRFNFIKDPAAAQIVCSWTDDATQLHLQKSGELGETRTSVTNQGDLVKATILMLTLAPFESKPLSDRMVKLAALHEVGHSLGICGHSSKSSDIMYFAIVAEHDAVLSDRDCATINTLYTTPPNEVLQESALANGGARSNLVSSNQTSWFLANNGSFLPNLNWQVNALKPIARPTTSIKSLNSIGTTALPSSTTSVANIPSSQTGDIEPLALPVEHQASSQQASVEVQESPQKVSVEPPQAPNQQ